MTTRERFYEALSALDRGSVADLRALLDEYPALAHARAPSSEPPYNGYFFGATLLHHVAGNPIRGPLPDTIVEVAELLLGRGADVDATCGGGPDQPGTGGGTVLGLVASGAQADRQGFTKALMDTLLDAGATMDAAGNGGMMWIALYHTVENRGQRDVARILYEHGHPVDLCYAAGLGLLGVVQEYLSLDLLPDDADRFYRNHRPSGLASTPRDVMNDALLFASVNGRTDVACELIRAGAEINAFRPWAGQTVTPLHGAAWAGWPETVRELLDRGADPELRDPRHDATPQDWAAFCGRHEVLPLF